MMLRLENLMDTAKDKVNPFYREECSMNDLCMLLVQVNGIAEPFGD
jgi:hypothetical protein